MLLQALNFVSVVATALMLWKGLSLYTNTESPIVVVLSGSMEPACVSNSFRSSPLLTDDM